MTLTKADIIQSLPDEHEECYGFDEVTKTMNKARVELASKVADELSKILNGKPKTKDIYLEFLNMNNEISELIKTLRGVK